MTKNCSVIILAAGKGTRMNSLKPKVMHEICGKSMIFHVIDSAMHLGASEIITVVSPGMRDVESAISGDVKIVVQEEQLGTGDAVKPALDVIKSDGNILVLYADTPLVTRDTLLAMLAKLNECDVAVLGFTPEDAAEYGRLVLDKNGELTKIVEFKDANDKERAINLCNSGIIAAKAKVFAGLVKKINNKNAKGEYYLTDIVDLAKKAGHKCGFVLGDEDEVLGVNNRVQLSEAEYTYQERLRNTAMIEGATLIDPETVYFSHDTKLGKDVVIHPNVIFGSGVWIEDGVEIKAFSHIENSHIRRGAVVGPYARIRPGSDIGEDAKIGNFVEVKNSFISKGAKVSHLSYIGDAEIGKDSNIGAGTITCNYDGYKKCRTIIEDDVFVGSNSALVAPIRLGKGSMVAAGSTITENVKAGALAISRGHQHNKDGWAKIFNAKNKK